MRNQSLPFLILLLLLFTQLGNATPVDSLLRFVRNIQTFDRLYPREQVYLHFDNTGYFMGETIWFKGYVVSAKGLVSTDLSRVLYVELVTPQGRVLQTQKLKIEKGQCHGSLSLGELLHAGFYEVRAYTSLMLNWSDAPVFSRVFPIFNAPKREGDYSHPRMVKVSHTERLPEMREDKPKSEKVNVTFFPEGGHLVNGLTSNVFFKATDKSGKALHITGRIFNNLGELVGEMQTQHDGMGRFTIIPKEEEEYYAEVIPEGMDKAQRFELPAALSDGYVMNVNTLRDEHITVQLTRPAAADTLQRLGVTILCRGEVVMFKPIDWQGSNTILLNIPKEQLPDGVNQLTLFDSQGRIYAERLFFIFPQRGINISLTGEKKELTPKGKVNLNFKVTDSNNQPMKTTFSLSVRDSDTDTPMNGVYGGSIETNLLLGSDLKGYIHDADYYLKSDDRLHRMHLDLLLCTQGWRKYDWTAMTHPEEFQVSHPVEEGIMVMGDLTSTFRHRKKEGVEMKVFLFNEAGEKRTGSAITDSLGQFAFLAEDFTGRWQMNIMTYEDNKLKEMNVNLKKVKSPKTRPYGEEETELYISESQENNHIAIQPDTVAEYDAGERRRWENLLPTVKVESSKEWQSEFVRKWHNIIYDMEDERMRMDETGEEYLESFAEWLQNNNPYFSYDINLHSNTIVATYKGRNVVFLANRLGTDGWLKPIGLAPSQEFSINLLDLTISDVEAMAISDKLYAGIALNQDAPTTVGLTDDEVLITLFVRNDYFRYKDKGGHRKTKIQGYAPERQFYIPDYSFADLPEEQDYRRTLYWNPTVETNTEGETSVTFYNTPHCRRMRVHIETINDQGEIGVLNELVE